MDAEKRVVAAYRDAFKAANGQYPMMTRAFEGRWRVNQGSRAHSLEELENMTRRLTARTSHRKDKTGTEG